jgi:hypothetical protein
MNINDYDWVMARLPKRRGVDKRCMQDCVQECLRDGFTKEDALAYTNLTEHANPKLNEKYACKRMGMISLKYRQRKFV